MNAHASDGRAQGCCGGMADRLFLSGMRRQPQVLSKAKEGRAYLVLHCGLRRWARLAAGVVVNSSLCRLHHRGRAGGRSPRKSIPRVHSRVNELCGAVVWVAECVVTRGDGARWDIVHMVLRLVVKAHRSRTVGYVVSCLLCEHDQR